MIDLKDPQVVAAFKLVQSVINEHQLTFETDYKNRLVAIGPHGDMQTGKGKTLLGAVRDFLRANSG